FKSIRERQQRSKGRVSGHQFLGTPFAVQEISSGDRSFDERSWSDVPWRTIIASVAVLVGTYVLLTVVLATVRILAWVAIAGFLAIVLAPAVRFVQRSLGGRRTLATCLVMFTALTATVGTLMLFLLPVRTQLIDIISDLPGTVHRAADGKGPLGQLVKRLHIESYVQDNEAQLVNAAERLSDSPIDTAATVLSAAFALVSILLMSTLFLTQSEPMGRAFLGIVPRRRRATVRIIATDAAGAVSGYMVGNLLVSLIAGVSAFVCLTALGVPSPVVLALWVAFADLIPLVGATIGAAASVLAAYLHSPTAGIIALIFFVIYQQLENGVIYPWLMARKVQVNPLLVLLSVLLAVELFGIVGALLAVPVSGAMQVIVKAIRQERPLEQLVLPDSLAEDG
ncbi:MAG: AI-2E family transporter, partial [Ilumatobacteraceae bacterium]|nr:AI-2E family transporter [Ilumatobacteraceae bacterium]